MWTFPSFAVYLFIVNMSLNVHGKPAVNHKHISFNDETIGVRTKRDEESSNAYLEQCGFVKFPNARRGFVNVLAFLDSSWPYSHRQAVMLNILRDRLRKSGLTEIHFFAVNFDDSHWIEKSNSTEEDDIEREAWLGVLPEEIESFTDNDRNLDAMAKKMTQDIEIIQDNAELGIWKSLGGSRNHVLVIDRCGKLTYQVIVPWSILHFPYVKAAILSTYKDEPCGTCVLVDDEKNVNNDLERLSGAISSNLGDTVTLSDESTMTGLLDDDSERSLDIEEETTVESNTTASDSMILAIMFSQSPLVVESIIADDEETTAAIITNYTDKPASAKKEENSNFHAENLLYREKTDSGDFVDSSIVNSSDLATPINHAIVLMTQEEMPNAKLQPDIRLRNESANLRDESQNLENNNDVKTVFDFADDFNVNDSTEMMPSNLEIINSSETNYEKQSEVASETKSRSFAGDLSAASKMPVNSVDSNFKDDDYLHTKSGRMTTDNVINDIRRETKEEISNADNSGQDGVTKIITEFTNDNEDNVKLMNLPIRVIMHAPHFHADRDSTRMHEYMVLETGSSIKSHGHLASSDATRLYRGPQDYYENIANNPETADTIEKAKWPMENLIFLNDESTGFFGEVADYWRDNGNLDNNEDNDDTEKPEYQRICDEGCENEKSWVESPNGNDEKFQKNDEISNDRTIGASVDTNEPMRSTDRNFPEAGSRFSATEKKTESEESIYRAEETRNKLIAHYSKLLPWIYYVLDK